MESDSSQSSSESLHLIQPTSPSQPDSDFKKDTNSSSDIRTSDTEPDYSLQKQKEQIITTSKNLLDFLEKEDFEIEDLNKFIKYLNDEKIPSDKYKFKTFLHLLTKVSENHFRNKHFNEKITQILYKLSDKITEYFSNFTICNIFKKNLLVLGKLLDKKIINIDKSIINCLFKYQKKYLSYLTQEGKSKEDLETFEKNRSIGENDQYICQLIREDSVEEFISYLAKESIPFDSNINDSIFETNRFLYEQKNVSLIQYAAFYGSIQIFKYLQMQGVELTQSLWLFAIHSNNPEIICMLEENHVEQYEIETMLCESIKCFHVNVMNYLYETKITDEKNINFNIIFLSILKNYNFIDLFDLIYKKANFSNDHLVSIFSKYDYLTVVDFYEKNNMDYRRFLIIISFYI